MRKTPFVTGEFYHIYNRGSDKRVVFPEKEDFDRFLLSMEYFNRMKPIGSIFEFSFIAPKLLGGRTTKLANIISYCLNSNHFHMILQQNIDNGISEFMKRLGGFTRYINIKYKRSGVLFQGKFKSKHINSNNYLLHLSAYVNQNNLVHQLSSRNYRSSMTEYISGEGICSKSIILSQFKNRSEYESFSKEALGNILSKKKQDSELRAILLEE
ncbi:MAG: transposase [bacterium]|nr:transposase [bacterium]